MAFICRPIIDSFDRASDFLRAYDVGADDLILTNRYTFDAAVHATAGAQLIYQEDYGTGEPDARMVSAIMSEAGPARRILAIGGGTVMDIAKLLSLDLGAQSLYEIFSGRGKVQKARTLVLVPTTCGTGSEVTNVSVVSFPDQGVKLGLADAALYADAAVLIPEFLKTLPFHPFVYSALDALVHASEAQLSPNRNAFTQVFSASAIHTLLSGFASLAEEGPEARFELLDRFQLASCQAGLAFGNAGCGTVHAMSYPVGAQFHVAHGEANYALFVPVLRDYAEHGSAEAVEALRVLLGNALRCDAADSIDAMDALLTRLIPRKPLHVYGMTAEQATVFAKRVIEKQRRLLKNSPIPMDEASIERIYACAL